MATGEPFKLNPTTLPIGFIVTSDKIDTWWKKITTQNTSSSYRKKSNPYPTPNVFFRANCRILRKRLTSQNHHQISDLPKKDQGCWWQRTSILGGIRSKVSMIFDVESRWFWIDSSLNLLRKNTKQLTFIKHPKKKERALNCRKVLETGKYHHLLYRLSSDHFMCSFLSQICFERKRLPHLHVWNI